LEIAMRRDQVGRNVARLVDAPGAGNSGIEPLTAEEARRLLNAAEGRPNGARWVIGLALGLRQGEALGLRWKYLDLETGEVKIWWQLQRLRWRHGCGDVAACTEGKHRRPCPKGCPKAKRRSGRPPQLHHQG
jgi:integrase